MNNGTIIAGLFLLVIFVAVLSQHVAVASSNASPISVSGGFDFSLAELFLIAGISLGMIFLAISMRSSTKRSRSTTN